MKENKEFKDLNTACPGFEEKVVKLALTPTGMRKLPLLSNGLLANIGNAQLAKNVHTVYGVMTTGKRSAHARDVVALLGNGCTYKYIEEVLGVPKGRARGYRHKAAQRGVLPPLLTARYATGFSLCTGSTQIH